MGKTGPPPMFNPEEVIEAIHAKDGLQTAVARALGCSMTTVVNYRHKYPEVEQAFADARERSVDLAETMLQKNIRKGDTTAIIFKLKCHGKNRGFVERTDHHHSGRIDSEIRDGRSPLPTSEELAAALAERAGMTAKPSTNGTNGNGNGHR